MTEPDLKPCPFCGGGAVFIANKPVVHCLECGADGGDWFDEIDAAEAWNRRVSDAPATQVQS